MKDSCDDFILKCLNCGDYEVDLENGDIISCKLRHKKKMKPTNRGNGYLCVPLFINGKSRTCLVHRIIMLSYLGFIPNNKHVDHIDGNKNNNKLNNLQLLSQVNNSRKSNCKLTKISVEDILTLRNYYNIPVVIISDMYSVDIKTIYNILNGTYNWILEK